MKFKEEFKRKMVKKLLLPGGKGVTELSKEIGVSTQTLYNWRDRFKVGDSVLSAASPAQWQMPEKRKAIVDYMSLADSEKGKWLRKNGLKSGYLNLWLEEFITMSSTEKYKEENRNLKARNKSLEKELLRKDKALAEVSALLILKKKTEEIFSAAKES